MDQTCRSSVSDLDCPGGESGARRNGRTVSPSRSRHRVAGCEIRGGYRQGPRRHLLCGELFTGDIFRGNIRLGTAKKFIDAPRVATRSAWCLIVGTICCSSPEAQPDRATSTTPVPGKTVASYQFGVAGASLINDVTLTDRGAWFTDSAKPQLYFVPLSKKGKPAAAFTTLQLSGPAAQLTGQFNLNGIRAAHHGRILIVAHTANAALYTVNPKTGASAPIAGISVPNVDGLVLASKKLWAVQNASNQITRIRLNKQVTAGTSRK